jgi:hypothetical protein
LRTLQQFGSFDENVGTVTTGAHFGRDPTAHMRLTIEIRPERAESEVGEEDVRPLVIVTVLAKAARDARCVPRRGAGEAVVGFEIDTNVGKYSGLARNCWRAIKEIQRRS